MAKKEAVKKWNNSAFPADLFKKRKVEFKEYYSSNFKLLQSAEGTFKNMLSLLLERQDFPAPKVTSRIKDRDSCIKKFELKYLHSLEESGEDYIIHRHITDLIGLRIICLYESDVYKVCEVIRSNFDIIDETNKTKSIEETDGFGYKGIHLDVKLKENRMQLPEYADISALQAEVQVRSIVQDAWSEIDHKLKYKNSIPQRIKRRIVRLAALFELADQEFEDIKNITAEEEARALSSNLSDTDEKIDVFNFLQHIKPKFENYTFNDFKIDNFIQEILNLKSDFTIKEFLSAINAHGGSVNRYKQYMEGEFGTQMNPYTLMRHILYLYMPQNFEPMMWAGPRKNFDRWREHGTVRLSELSE